MKTYKSPIATTITICSAALILCIGMSTVSTANAQEHDPSVNSCISFDHNSNSLTSFAINSWNLFISFLVII